MESLTLLFEVTAKVEALRMDGATAYTFQGRLSMAESESEPLNMALVVPEAVWRSAVPGTMLTFPLEQ